MSGAETTGLAHRSPGRDMAVSGEGGRGPPTEKEEIQHLLNSGTEEDGEQEAEEYEGSIEGSKAQEVVEHAVQTGAKK